MIPDSCFYRHPEAEKRLDHLADYFREAFYTVNSFDLYWKVRHLIEDYLEGHKIERRRKWPK